MANMAVPSLYAIFASSFESSADVRQAAEKHLKEASRSSGFASAMLKIITDPEGDKAVKQSAAVYFKNWSEKYWLAGEDDKFVVADGEKEFIREHLTQAITLVAAQQSLRSQLLSSLNTVIRADYPRSFGQLPQQISAMMSGSDSMPAMEAGILVFYELVNWKGYGPESEKLGSLYEAFFPTVILPVAQQALAFAKSQTSIAPRDEALWVVKAAVKTFFAAIRYRWTLTLLAGESFFPWASLFNDLLAMSIPEDLSKELQAALAESDADAVSEIERSCPFWKARKWAMHCHNRVLQRYVSNSDPEGTFGAEAKQVTAFAKVYSAKLAEPIVSAFFRLIDEHLRTPSVGHRAFSLICDFLANSIRFKASWRLVQGHLMPILQQFVFPAACWSKQDDALWEEDPAECIRSRFVDSLLDDGTSRSFSAISLIVDVIKCRRKHVLMPWLGFLTQKLAGAATSTDKQSACVKEGVFYVLGSMSRLLMTAPELRAQMESFLMVHVAPMLVDAPLPFLQARACWVVEQLLGEQAEFKFANPNNVLALLQGVAQCLLNTAAALPVRTQAALAISPLLDFEEVQEAITAILPRVVESILQVSEQVELDAIAFSLERIVGMFPDELAPFAVQLCAQLVHSAVRIMDAGKTATGSKNDGEQGMYFEDSDKMMAAVGLMSTINTLVEAMSASADIMAQLEPVCLPLILHILRANVTDVYEETFELLDSITFARKAVSTEMWSVFEAVYRCFKYTTVGADYLGDMYTSLDNFISYGRDTIAANDAYLAAIVDIINTVFAPRLARLDDSASDAPSSESDLISACKLSESLMLNLRGKLSETTVAHTLDLVIASMMVVNRQNTAKLDDDKFRGGFHTITCYVTHLQVILNGIYYDPAIAMHALERRQYTAVFFEQWLSLASSLLVRVHDRRLNIVAINALLRCPSLLATIRSLWTANAVPVFVDALSGLPKALANRSKLMKEFEEGNATDSDDFLEDSDYNELDDDESGDEAIHQRAFLNSQVSQLSSKNDDDDDDDDDKEQSEYEDEDFEEAADELEEELFFETIFDTLDFGTVATEAVHSITADLCTGLNVEQRHFLQSLARH